MIFSAESLFKYRGPTHRSVVQMDKKLRTAGAMDTAHADWDKRNKKAEKLVSNSEYVWEESEELISNSEYEKLAVARLERDADPKNQKTEKPAKEKAAKEKTAKDKPAKAKPAAGKRSSKRASK
jgi:hypothetical protein